MDELWLNIITFSILFMVLGFYLAYLYGRNTTQFRWSEYVALMCAPTIVVFIEAYLIDIRILTLYLASAMLGFVLEFFLGFAYHQVLNRKLWVYDSQAYAVGGYTSWLTLPMWGVAGVIFWTLAKVVGL